MGAILGWFDDIAKNRDAAADPGDNSPRGNTARAACDWAARKGGFIAGAPWIQATCRPYWDDDPGYPPPGIPAPPFEGGQCSGVSYRIFFNRTENPLSQDSDVVRLGPIAGMVEESCENSSGIPGKCTVLVTNGGQDRNLISFVPEGGTPSGWFIRSVDRIDGAPDECGNPPDIQPEPVDVPGLPPDGSPIDVSPPGWAGPPILITFDPASPDAPSYGPITTTYGGPSTVFGPSGGGGPSGPDPAPPPTPGDPINPFDGGDGGDGGSASGDVPPEDDVGRVCIGMLWDLWNVPDHRGGIPGSSPLRFYETAGSLQLRVRAKSGRHWTTPTLIRSAEGSVVVAAQGLVVEGYDITVKPSFGPVKLTPIYAIVAML